MQGQVQREGVQGLLRVILRSAIGYPDWQQVPGSTRRSLLRRQDIVGRHPEIEPTQPAPARTAGLDDGDAVDRSAACTWPWT